MPNNFSFAKNKMQKDTSLPLALLPYNVVPVQLQYRSPCVSSHDSINPALPQASRGSDIASVFCFSFLFSSRGYRQTTIVYPISAHSQVWPRTIPVPFTSVETETHNMPVADVDFNSFLACNTNRRYIVGVTFRRSPTFSDSLTA